MGGPFQPPIRAPGHGRGSRLIALTSLYSPARRQSCGFFVLQRAGRIYCPGAKVLTARPPQSRNAGRRVDETNEPRENEKRSRCIGIAVQDAAARIDMATGTSGTCWQQRSPRSVVECASPLALSVGMMGSCTPVCGDSFSKSETENWSEPRYPGGHTY